MTKEDILKMDTDRLKVFVAEHVFNARVIGQSKDHELKLLVGDFGIEATKPLRGSWQSAQWHYSEEAAWTDCPDYAEDNAEAWKVIEKFPLVMVERVEIYQGHVTTNVTIYPEAGEERNYTASSRTLAESACKAALLAVFNL